MTTNGATTYETPPPMTASDLFGVLSEGIQRIRDGETTPANVNAIVNASATMLRIVKLQMDYAKMTGKTPDIPMLLTGDGGAMATSRERETTAR